MKKTFVDMIRPKLNVSIKSVNKTPVLVVFVIVLFVFAFVYYDLFSKKTKTKTKTIHISSTESSTKNNKVESIEVLKNIESFLEKQRDDAKNNVNGNEIIVNQENTIDNKNEEENGTTIEDTKSPKEEFLQKIQSVELDAQAKQLKDELEHRNRVFKSRLELEEEARLSPTTAKMDFAINKTEEKNNSFSTIENFTEETLSLRNDRIAPKSEYMLLLGNTIPAILETGINSELPGMITARVSGNVYDSAKGEHLLIPRGSQLVGTYRSDIATGQSRIMAAWNRINFPDGSYLNLNKMSGADLSGMSGFKDQVNNHYLKIFSHATLLSLITAGVSMTQEESSPSKFHEAMTKSLGSNLGQVASDLVRKQMNVQPTIDIRSGYNFVVMVSEDIIFESAYKE